METMQERARAIIGTIATERRVEFIVRSVAHTDNLVGELSDLCQEVYCILLDYPADKIVDLWETDCMPFFLVRIITNQLRSRTSRFYYTYRKFQALCNSIDGLEFKDPAPTY